MPSLSTSSMIAVRASQIAGELRRVRHCSSASIRSAPAHLLEPSPTAPSRLAMPFPGRSAIRVWSSAAAPAAPLTESCG
jgi:hypothetical protein